MNWNTIIDWIMPLVFTALGTFLGKLWGNSELNKRVKQLEVWQARLQGQIEGRLQERYRVDVDDEQ